MVEYNSLKELLTESDDIELIRHHAQMLHYCFLNWEEFLKAHLGEVWYMEASIEFGKWLAHKSFGSAEIYDIIKKS